MSSEITYKRFARLQGLKARKLIKISVAIICKRVKCIGENVETEFAFLKKLTHR